MGRRWGKLKIATKELKPRRLTKLEKLYQNPKFIESMDLDGIVLSAPQARPFSAARELRCVPTKVRKRGDAE